MNQEIALINRLDAMGIQLRLNEGKLTTRSAPGSVTAEIAALIRQQRDGLVAFLRQRELGEALKSAAIPARGDAMHPLSYAQKRLWLIDRMGDTGTAYHIPAALRIEGRLDRGALERAFGAIVERHAVLRTVYVARDGEPMCEVRPYAGFTLDRVDLAPGATLAGAMAAENARPFDLSRDLMLRATLVDVGADCHVLLLNMHHIASDGWSMGILVKELVALYEGTAPAPLAVQYGDYAAWQSDWLAGGAQRHQLDYWKRRLDGIPHLHALPTDRPRPARQQYEGAHYTCTLDDASALHAVCRDAGATSFIALQLAFAVLLSRWSHETDIVFGTPVANRLRPELEGLIGFFVNTLVLRNQIDATRSFADLLGEAVRNTAADFDHQSLPFDVLVETLNPVRSPAHAPLVQIMFSMHNAVPAAIRLDGLSLAGVDTAGVSAKFDLTLNVVESGGTLAMSWQYSTALFNPDTIAAMAQQYLALLRDIGRRPAVPLARLDMLAPGERERLLALNGVRRGRPGTSIPHLFREQAGRAPDRVALVDGERQLTYAQLDDEVRRLAAWLVRRGVRDEQPVGIHMDRGSGIVVAMLAILHAGGSYVPMDVTMPAERVALVVRDTGCELVLCSARRRAVLDGLPTEPVALDLLDTDGPRHDDLPDARGGRRLAYLMYTSGSTGQPKGAMIEQRGIVRLVCDAGYCSIAPGHTVAQSSNSSFDAATFEIFGALLNGACLSFIDVDTLVDPDRLERAIERQGIDILFLTTSLFNQSAHLRPRMFGRLDTLLIGGEAVDKQAVDNVLTGGAAPRRFVNGYGPTENTTFTTAFEMRDVRPAYPIGRPIRNTSCFILGSQRELLPFGALGELYTGGDGVARGYLNRPQETAASFVADPFGGDGLLYKTGDLARWLPDGTLDYVGRSDFQIKLRGFRIELGEIEASLARLDAVQEAVVLARADGPGERRLVAYVTAAPGATADAATLHDALAAQLPPYMLPSAYVVLDALPLTANGKLDRRALPAPRSDAYLHARYEAPQGEHEQALAAVWQDLLRVERVGRNDDFFALGGHSLMAVQLCARLHDGSAIALRDVFEHPTLQALARRVAQAAGVRPQPIARADRAAPLPLSWGQQSIWLVEQLGAVGAAYHMPVAVRLAGTLDPHALRRALDRMVERHESLRTTFDADRQAIAAPGPFALREIDATGWSDDAIARCSAREAAAPFDLAAGPLVRACLLKVADDVHVLLFVMHHIISDGWSMGVLVRELGALYAAYRDGLPDPLPPLAIQYADYAVWQRERLQGALLQEQLDYWTRQLGGAPALLELPLDRPRPSSQSHKGRTITFALDAGLSAGLNALAQEHGMTLFMVLYTGFSILLAKLSGQDDIVVGVPAANRRSAALEGLIGFFVNTLALRLRLTGEASVADVLAQARESTLGAYEHQELPFEQVVEALRPPRTLAHSPVFQVMFSLQNMPASALELPGLRLEAQSASADVAQFDLSMALHESKGRIAGDINYVSDLFDAATIDRWIGHFQTVLAAMVRDARQPVAALSLLDDAGLHRVTRLFNATTADYPRERLIHELFAEQAARTPAAIALRHDDACLSYAGLDGRATALARRLRTLGVGPDRRVGIFLERGIDMVVAVLATLKAGGAYVPLDPAYPAARLAWLLDDCGPAAVLTSGALRERLPDGHAVLAVDGNDGDGDDDAGPLDVPGLTSRHLAYVIYTSGSTGMPKGVMVEHRQVLHLWRALGLAVFDACAPASTIALNAGLSFDASVQALVQLLSGHCVAIVGAPVRLDAHAFLAFLADKRVDTFDCTPLQLELLVQAGLLDAGLDALKRVLIGGEAIGPALWNTLSACPSIEFYNVYGPTECTVDATCIRINGDRNGPSIGRPLANTSVYVVDAAMRPVPVGVCGEMVIGGAGVARGYLGRPELTLERFIDDPAGGGKRYRTGDLARWRDNGELEYLGRNDFQFKLRGFRIEPGEIEACLTKLADVREAVVLAREESPGNTQLVAYYTAAAPVAAARLRAHALEGLPAHMVPAAYVHLPAWPLTANGKLDRRALPAPQPDAHLHARYDAAADDHEPAWLELPLDRPRAPGRSREERTMAFALDGDSSAALHALAHGHGMPPSVVLYAGFSILLARLGGQDDVAVRMPMFPADALALRLRLAAEASVADVLAQAKDVMLAACADRQLPFEQVAEALRPAHTLRLEAQSAAADLAMALHAADGRIAGKIHYASDLFYAATIERWIGHFRTVLAAMARDARQPGATLALLDDAELHRVTRLFNATGADYPHDRLIHQLFEEQATRTPDAIALSHAGTHLTYAQLNEEANRLAHHLRAHGAGPGRLVAVSARRDAALVTGLLAVLKAGAAYVPLDPDYPSERQEHMLRDSAAIALLTHGQPSAALRRQLREDVPVIDLHDGRQWGHHSDANPVVDGLDPACLGYVMYTSGSTGLPKGVLVEHRAVVNHVHAFGRRLDLGPADRVLQFVSVSFDAAVEEIFGALACGAALVLRTEDWVAGPDAFWSLCAQERISVVDLPTRFWAELAQSGAPAPACVRWVVIGGEAVGERALASWLAAGPRPRLLNTYGPTEATVSVTATEPRAAGDWRNIGGPGANTRIYILDRHMMPVPIGVAGELHIGGVQVARGYLNRPDLSAERFVDDPFGGAGRLYKSGDLGRWRADGTIDYLGRNDAQVKIRGFRIEPGEIEATLAQELGVDVVVLAREDEPGDKRLVAYYGGATALAAGDLRARAARLLPAYMMPAAFVHVPSWPQTPNGKLDRNALQRPTAHTHAGRSYDAPLGPTEAAVARLWEALLKIGPLGRHDNFFELGGHSLLAIQMLTQARVELGVAPAPASVFTHQTVAAFASVLDAAGAPARQAAGADDHVVLHDHAGGKAPLFCFPGLFANGLEFGAVAAALQDERSVHAFVCPTLGGARWDGWEMPDLAAMYADRVAGIAQGGPVVFLGWSMGGYLAFEVARLLRGRVDVRFVAMVDVHDTGEAALAPRSPMADEDSLDGMLAQWSRGTGMPAQWHSLFARLDHVEKQLAWERLQDMPAFAPTGTDVDGAEYRAWARFNHGRMTRRHALRPAQVPVHVWAAGQSVARAGASLRDWTALADVRFASVVDGSDHRTVLDHPAFLEQLRRQLAASEPGAQTVLSDRIATTAE
jgi:amino acid adenylation domain-containing protein